MLKIEYCYSNNTMFDLCKRWWQYLNTRFMILLILPLTIIQFMVLVKVIGSSSSVIYLVIGYGTFLTYFLLLRLLDEQKDFQHDSLYYPDRPVQTGLISSKELGVLIFFICITTLAVNTVLIPLSISGWLWLTGSYIWLMRQEFFIKDWLRPRLILYTLTHQVSVIILLTYLIRLNSQDRWDMFTVAILLINWLIIFLIELGRKIRSTIEEPTGARDTYSSYLGRTPAVVLWLLMAGVLIWYVSTVFQLGNWYWILWLLALVIGLNYVKVDTPASSKLVALATVLICTLLEIGMLI